MCYTSKYIITEYLVHLNSNHHLVWCAKIGVDRGFRVHRGSLLWPLVTVMNTTVTKVLLVCMLLIALKSNPILHLVPGKTQDSTTNPLGTLGQRAKLCVVFSTTERVLITYSTDTTEDVELCMRLSKCLDEIYLSKAMAMHHFRCVCPRKACP